LRKKKARFQSVVGNELELIVNPGYKKVVRDGIREHVFVEDMKSIQFHGGFYETDNKEEIRFLESHPHFGRDFFRVPTEEEIQEEAKKEISKAYLICVYPGCGYKAKDVEDMEKHLQEVHSEYKCDFPGCDYIAESEEQLQAHKASAHGRWDKEKKKK